MIQLNWRDSGNWYTGSCRAMEELQDPVRAEEGNKRIWHSTVQNHWHPYTCSTITVYITRAVNLGYNNTTSGERNHAKTTSFTYIRMPTSVRRKQVNKSDFSLSLLSLYLIFDVAWKVSIHKGYVCHTNHVWHLTSKQHVIHWVKTGHHCLSQVIANTNLTGNPSQILQEIHHKSYRKSITNLTGNPSQILQEIHHKSYRKSTTNLTGIHHKSYRKSITNLTGTSVLRWCLTA